MRRGLAAALAALLAVLARVTAADLVFRVPEVLCETRRDREVFGLNTRPEDGPPMGPKLVGAVTGRSNVRHAAAARPVGTAGRNISGAGAEPDYSTAVGEAGGQAGGQEAGGQAEGLLEVHYEEYFVEHDVSTAAARNAALHLDLDTVPETRVGCGACSRRDLEYCETRVLADHCCCERRFLREPFPWLPHTCYVGPGRCRPLAHDCARYTRLRDCCCLRRLAHRWKGILSRSSRPGETGAPLLPLAALLAALLAARL